MGNTEYAPSIVGDETASAAATARSYSAALIAFAQTGRPETPQTPWPDYDRHRRATLRLNVSSTVVDDPDAERRALWIF